MKILLVNWQDPANPQAGGAEIHLKEIFSRLVGWGHEVTWLASGWRGAPPSALSDGLQIRRTGSRYTFGAAAILYHRRQLRDQPFDLVVEALNKVPLYTPLWSGRPVALIVHHLFGTTAFQEASVPLAAMTWLQERPIPWVYRNVPIQAISESTRADLLERGLRPDEISVIHPGIDIDFFRPADKPARTAVPTFVYLGRLKRYKCVDLIIRALALVRARGTEVRLVIAGKGDDERRLRELVDDLDLEAEIEFAGYVSEEEKRELFRNSWANVFVSPKEGWGITNLEAAGCGTATLASDAPGLRESVVHEKTGILVPHGDIEALATAMDRFARNPGEVEAFGAAAREFASEFTWELAAQKTERHLIAAAGLTD